MGSTLARSLVILGGLIFLGFGSWLLAIPEALGGIGIELNGPDARIDVRATYGGLELGIALFLFLCATRAEWLRVGLIAATCGIAGFGFGRLVGIVLEGGEAGTLMWSFLAIEAVTTGVYVAVLCRGSGGGGRVDVGTR